MSDDGLTGIKKRWVGGDEVIISRAQYDVLMRFVNAPVIRKAAKINTEVRNLLGDLRAAGIQTEET